MKEYIVPGPASIAGEYGRPLEVPADKFAVCVPGTSPMVGSCPRNCYGGRLFNSPEEAQKALDDVKYAECPNPEIRKYAREHGCDIEPVATVGSVCLYRVGPHEVLDAPTGVIWRDRIEPQKWSEALTQYRIRE